MKHHKKISCEEIRICDPKRGDAEILLVSTGDSAFLEIRNKSIPQITIGLDSDNYPKAWVHNKSGDKSFAIVFHDETLTITQFSSNGMPIDLLKINKKKKRDQKSP